MNGQHLNILFILIQLFCLVHSEINGSPNTDIINPLKSRGKLQGVGVRGRLMCGKQPLESSKVKIVDLDPRPDLDDLLGETLTDSNGNFQLSGATREDGDIEPCQRKVIWKVPAIYYNNGTLLEWFDIGTVNMEILFPHEERDCRHR